MIINFLLLVVAFVVLVGGAEVLVRGAAGLALRFGLSSFFIGMTIVGFGTSSPELATCIQAAFDDVGGISLGNIVGSNIFNLAVILGLTAVICPIPVHLGIIRSQVSMMIFAGVGLYLALLTGGMLTRVHGAGFLVVLVVFMVYVYRKDKPEDPAEMAAEEELTKELGVTPTSIWTRPWVCVVALVVGLAALLGGARLLVHVSVEIAQAMGVSELVIGLTIIAAGTSMPELATSAVAAWRKQSDIALGNVIGSNIYNTFGVGGVTALLFPQQISSQLFWIDLPFLALLSFAALPMMFTGARISRVEGALFVLLYCGYMAIMLTVSNS